MTAFITASACCQSEQCSAAGMSDAHRGPRPGVGGGRDVGEVVGAGLHAAVHLQGHVQDQVCEAVEATSGSITDAHSRASASASEQRTMRYATEAPEVPVVSEPITRQFYLPTDFIIQAPLAGRMLI